MKKIIAILSLITALSYGNSNISAMTTEPQALDTPKIFVPKDEPEEIKAPSSLTVKQLAVFTLLVVGLVISWKKMQTARKYEKAWRELYDEVESTARDAMCRLNKIEQEKDTISHQLITAKKDKSDALMQLYWANTNEANAKKEAMQWRNKADSLEQALDLIKQSFAQFKNTSNLREALASLGFAPDQKPSPQEIKKRYFFMISNFHPDKYRDDPNKSREAEAIAKRLNNAKSQL